MNRLGFRLQVGFRQDRLKEFDEVAGGVFDQNLLAAHACDDLVAELYTHRTEFRDHPFQIVHFNREAVPAPGSGIAPSGID